MNNLYTIGYEGRDLESFVGTLRENSINCLNDVREIPLSRKRGFSKSSLGERLGQEGISYVHFKELGSPKAVRNELKASHNYVVFFEEMDRYLSGKAEVVDSVYQYVKTKICCLICFEKLAAQCHRKKECSSEWKDPCHGCRAVSSSF